MSRISVVEKNEASEDVKEILTEIEGALEWFQIGLRRILIFLHC